MKIIKNHWLTENPHDRNNGKITLVHDNKKSAYFELVCLYSDYEMKKK